MFHLNFQELDIWTSMSTTCPTLHQYPMCPSSARKCRLYATECPFIGHIPKCGGITGMGTCSLVELKLLFFSMRIQVLFSNFQTDRTSAIIERSHHHHYIVTPVILIVIVIKVIRRHIMSSYNCRHLWLMLSSSHSSRCRHRHWHNHHCCHK